MIKHRLKLLYLWFVWSFIDKSEPRACTWKSYLWKLKVDACGLKTISTAGVVGRLPLPKTSLTCPKENKIIKI